MWYRRLDATLMLLNYLTALAWYPVSINIALALPRGHLAPLAFLSIVVPSMIQYFLIAKVSDTQGLIAGRKSKFLLYNCVIVFVVTVFSLAAEIIDAYAMNCYPIPCAMRDYSGLVYVTLPVIPDWKIDFGLFAGFSGLCGWACLIFRCVLNWRIIIVSGGGEIVPQPTR